MKITMNKKKLERIKIMLEIIEKKIKSDIKEKNELKRRKALY